MQATKAAGHGPLWLLLALFLPLTAARPAQAMQPLADFLRSAYGENYDVRQSHELRQQRALEAQAAKGRLAPALVLTGTYTRNAYAAKLPYGTRTLSLAPYDQLDASATLTVPVFDVTTWAKRRVAIFQANAAAAGLKSDELGAAKQVAQLYYALRGGYGVLQSAKNSQAFAARNLELTQARHAVGTVSSLEVARAESDLAQAEQDVAAAELQVTLGQRNLETASGLWAEEGGALLEVPLADETPLARWLALADAEHPTRKKALADAGAARAGERAAKWGYLPSLSLSAQERATNASALNGGHTFVWQAKANLTWQLDATLTPTEKAQRHAARLAGVRYSQIARQVADNIFSDWANIRSNQATSRAARAQVRATQLAESLAMEKAAAGVITQLDVTQARRDAYAAQVRRIQADANLLFYRTLLRLDASHSVADFEEPAS